MNWSDNAPGQFKECFLFFYLDYIVPLGQFLRADFKFLLEGHTYSVCDRRFGTIQTLFKKREIIAIPRQWATVLEESNLSNIEVCWVTLAMIKDFKSFLRLRYVSRNEDIEKQRFEVKNIAWLNFGYGEEVDDNRGSSNWYLTLRAFSLDFRLIQRKYLGKFHLSRKNRPQN